MKVVSNTSPIINLACINRLDILKHLYKTIYIPSAVYNEIINTKQPGSSEVKEFDWIIHLQLNTQAVSLALQNELDPGEAEAIALAHELKSDLLLLDERKGRTAAARLNISFIGLLGILILAKSKNIIPTVKPVLNDLRSIAGFWIQQDLYNKIIETAGEK